jgi:hypothetical protein
MTPGSWLVPGVSIDLGGLTLAPDIHHPPPYLETGRRSGVRLHGVGMSPTGERSARG